VDLASAQWRTSSYSGGNGGQCIQVATQANTREDLGQLCAIRDSKDPAGPVLVFRSRQWRAFTTVIKAGTTSPT
jgi:Domain of unknown function (DUF397)